jgi:anti-anti-sigma factor
MEITITNPSDDCVILQLKGKFTLEHIQEFKDKLTPVIKNTLKSIFIDFSNVVFIDSSGIGVLILFMNSAKNLNINFVLYNIKKDVLTLLKTDNIDKFFSISTSFKLKKIYPGIPF